MKPKATTKSTPAMSGEVFEQAKTRFLRPIIRIVKVRDVPVNLIINLDQIVINLDQTAIHLVPTGDWIMATTELK